MKRIGIYGGSFNPVHKGHVRAAEVFVQAMELDMLLLIPAGTPPHKELPEMSPSGAQRAKMLRQAIAHIPQAVLDDTELNVSGKSYTYDTLISLRDRWPEDEFFLLVGTDMFLSFPQWYRYRDILQMVQICVLDRWELTRELTKSMEEMQHQLTEQGGKITRIKHNLLDISSTTARRMIFFGCGEDYVPAQAMDVIVKERLYGAGGDFRQLPIEELTRISVSLHDPKRVPHALGCCRTAQELALFHGADPSDAARAGILHDITKALGVTQQLQLCEKYDIMADEYAGAQAKILHGKTAAAVAEHIFGENSAVCSAVSWHTTGRANMSLLEKIIYLADYIEPTRDFAGVEKLRELARTDLDAAVLLGIQMTIAILQQTNRPLNRHSAEARDYLLRRKGTE